MMFALGFLAGAVCMAAFVVVIALIANRNPGKWMPPLW